MITLEGLITSRIAKKEEKLSKKHNCYGIRYTKNEEIKELRKLLDEIDIENIKKRGYVTYRHYRGKIWRIKDFKEEKI